MNYKILVSGAGLGMGNASRLSALIEAITKKGEKENFTVSFHVFSWGAGYQFLKQIQLNTEMKFDLDQLHPYGIQQGFLRFAINYISNTKSLFFAILKDKPDLLLLDSDYHFLSYLISRKPKIYIGQAYDVLDRAKQRSYKSKTFFEKINFFFREKLDSIYQRTISTEVLVPSFTLDFQTNSRFTKIPLIVRQEFLSSDKVTQHNNDSIAVLLSGSEIDKELFLKLLEQYKLHTIAPSKDEMLLSHADCLEQYEIILTQGGLTSISEIISLDKFLVVFPMKNHPEQILNALEIETLGLGMKADLEELEDFQNLFKKIKERKQTLNRSKVNCAGAEKAAEIINTYLTKPSGN